MVSQGYQDILDDGEWATSGDRDLPGDVGITRADGWPVAYEQIGSGSTPERPIFNELMFETWSALIDIANTGVPAWDTDVDYTPATDAHCFVTTATGLWRTNTATGPGTGNATDPDAAGQTVWSFF